MKRKVIITISISIFILMLIIIVTLIKKNNTTDLFTTNNDCLNKNNKCENGMMLEINVNNREKVNFYVVDDDGKKLTLIMDHNIKDDVSWSTNDTSCSNGPENLINYIKELTKDWQNIKERDYTISDSNNCYNKKTEKMRARIPTIEDVSNLGCQYFYEETCPEYLMSNLDSSSGYWLSTSNNPIDVNAVYMVYKKRNLGTTWVITNKNYGLRLIIEVEK